LRDNIQGITKPAIRRLARRGGVKRISAMIYEETRGVLKSFLESVIRDAVTYTEHAKRKTVTSLGMLTLQCTCTKENNITNEQQTWSMPSSDKAEPSTASVVERFFSDDYPLFTRAAPQITWKWITVLTDDEHGATGFSVFHRELIDIGFLQVRAKELQQEILSCAQQSCNLLKLDLYAS
jgi:histone H3/H4